MTFSTVTLPALPTVMPVAGGAIWITSDGVVEKISTPDAVRNLTNKPALFCHRKWTASRLEIKWKYIGAPKNLDALELFAFVRPGEVCLPTAKGLGQNLGLDTHGTDDDHALLIPQACQALLDELTSLSSEKKKHAAKIATMMTQGGWGWGSSVLAALDHPMPTEEMPIDSRGAAVWQRLQENPDYVSSEEPGAFPIKQEAVENRLNVMLGKNAELRPQQKIFSTSLLPAFAPPKSEEDPTLVMAEAGTGTGKTLGYLAPATVWAEENKAPVWVSTFTRNLQHQVAEEMTRYYPDREERDSKVVIRKGRENYLCLLNLEDELASVVTFPDRAIPLGLMARWAESSPDGDLAGASFPTWLTELFSFSMTTNLSDHHGECIHSACRHYQKCFVEKSRMKARKADIVIANHALVMSSAAVAADMPPPETSISPTRYIFDEGHHVFDVADSAFAISFSCKEAENLRRWIRGSEGSGKSRAKGIKTRLDDILVNNEEAIAHMNQVLEAASILPTKGWQDRLLKDSRGGDVEELFHEIRADDVEEFFHKIRKEIKTREEVDPDKDLRYTREEEIDSLDEEHRKMAAELAGKLKDISVPLDRLNQTLLKMLADQVDDSDARMKLEGIVRGLMRRVQAPLLAWEELLQDVANATPQPKFVDWMEIARENGKEKDIALKRHYLDPSEPFSRAVLKKSHGTILTSATLTDPSDSESEQPQEADWDFASKLSGAIHLATPAIISTVTSPFNYKEQVKIFIVKDVHFGDYQQIGEAMGGLMTASGGGALGLFTAIHRLKGAYPHLAKILEPEGLSLYAQHVDDMSIQTLLQIFREDPTSCLLGTDATRDGIDVPGRALQLIVYDRVPWPGRNLLFKARANQHGGTQWKDRAIRMKLRQAFGRLIRRHDDRGVFVMLGERPEEEMLSAFPKGVDREHDTLENVIKETASFLNPAKDNI